ncbi:MAG TPA: hypothetical protein VE135_20635 [Pyrinomonadaceae bacterium]|nr:hypothetical protein [Pyrinomonadaceae bacterium]
MRRTNLTELAGNPNFISGIYNYCDRWCERCPFTTRCLVYAQEKEDEDDSPESRDLNNEAFWRKLASVFQETRELITKWAEEAGIDLSQATEEAETSRVKRRDRTGQSRLARAGKAYANAVSQWFREFDQIISVSDDPSESDTEQTERLEEAREVIQWYQYQIAVKTMRALSSLDDETADPEDDEFPRDSDGSAKVALIGIDRSISAWRIIQICLPERAQLIVPFIMQLEQLRRRTERKFPAARDFIRPGFDEILGQPN